MLAGALKTLLSVGVYVGAGVLLFLVAYNRHILPLRDRCWRRIGVPLVFFGLLAVGVFGGTRLGFSRWVAVPLLVLAGVVAGEIRRLGIRHRFRAEAAIEPVGERLSWKHPVTTHDLVVRRYEIRLAGWKGPRFRIAQVSDLHVHGGYPYDFYLEAMDRVTSLRADACFLTGDILSKADELDLLAGVLRRPVTRFGSFASFGNHDLWTASEALKEILRECNIPYVTDAPVRLDAPGGTLVLHGCEDPWSDEEWTPPPVADDEFLVVLSHTADNIYRLAEAGSALVFSGHYHGGQLALPFLGALAVPSRFGRRFDHGHFRIGDTHLFVSAGVGTHFPPLRLYCRPEIVVVDLLPPFDLSTASPAML